MVDEILDLWTLGVDSTVSVIHLRDEIIPMLSLRSFLIFPGNQNTEHITGALVVKQHSKRVAFFITKVVSQQQIVVRTLAPGMANVFGICGGTILANGEPGLIIDLKQITDRYFSTVQTNPNSPLEGAAA